MAHFVRAVEVHSFPTEVRRHVVDLGMSLLKQQGILSEAGKSTSEQIEGIEKIFNWIAEYPELISRYPRFRKVCKNKMDEFISKHGFASQLINDMPTILRILETRSDYVKDEPLPTPTPTPTHSYNLRPRK